MVEWEYHILGDIAMFRKLLKYNTLKDLRAHSKPFNYCILGFLLPFLGAGLAILIRAIVMESQSSIAEFSMLFSDAYHQYFPFFKDFRAMLLSGDSLLFNWTIGMGIDYTGLFAYYLGSPLNLLSVFVPESWLVDYFTLLNPIRLGLAGLFFSLMLKRLFGKNDFSIALFGSFYATSAWAFGYMWNTMWVDTFALLPLVVLGTVELLEKRKFILYTVSLFLSVFINYYIGFFTCVFTLLVFICYQISRWRGVRQFLTDLSLMALFTILAIGMTAILSLPTLAALQTTSASVNEFPEGFKVNIPDKNTITELRTAVTEWLTATFPNAEVASEGYKKWEDFLTNSLTVLTGMKKVATNTFAAIKPNYSANENLPNIYCGIFANIFLFLYLTCRRVKWRDRICGLVLLLFINLSFILRQLDYIWHGFHFTNMIPYRFSFLYSFVLVFISYRVWTLRRRIRLWQVLVALGLTLVMLVNSDMYVKTCETFAEPAFQNALTALQENWNANTLKAVTSQIEAEDLFNFVNFLFLTAYAVVLIWMSVRLPIKKGISRKEKRVRYQAYYSRRKAACTGLACVIAAEFVFNIVFFGITFNSTNLSHYPRGTEDSERIINIMHELEEDTLFYRAETTHTQTYNDGALNGYNGVTTFTSSANADVTNFMRGLGYGAMENWNRYAFEEGSPVANLYLNLKYMIERQGQLEKNPYFEDIHSSGKVHLLKNKYYLPLGFMADPALAESNFHDLSNTANAFEKQNTLLSDTLGEQIEPWSLVCGDNVSIASTDTVTISNVNTNTVGSCSYKASSSGSVFYTYTFDRSGFFCISYNMPKRNDITVSYDDGSGYKTLYTEGYAIPFTMAVCQVEPGDRVQITLKCKSGESSSLKLWGGLLDQRVMDYAHQELSRNTLELTKFENTFVEGNITCDKAGLLYTSIPQSSDNWHVYVDGEEKDVTLIGGAMVGVMLEEGSHTVTFRYRNKAFNLGCIVSAVCAVVFAAICWFIYYYLKKNPGKFEKVRALTVPPLPPAPPPMPTKKDISEQERAKAVKERMKKNKKRKKR